MAQLKPLPLTVSCCSNIQVGFTFELPAHQDSPGQRAVKRVCVTAQETLGVGRIPQREWAFWRNISWHTARIGNIQHAVNILKLIRSVSLIVDRFEFVILDFLVL